MPKCSKCGRSFETDFKWATMCSSCFAKKKDDRFYKYGKTKCKMCGATIPGDQTHCGICFKKYLAKK